MKTDNELIAEFMGMHKADSDKILLTPDFVMIDKECKYWGVNQLEYDTSWDWLHPVIDKIEKLMPHITIPDDLQNLKEGNHGCEKYIDVISLPICSTIDEAYTEVVKFIKWYNNDTTRT